MNQVSFLPDGAESYKSALGLSKSLQQNVFVGRGQSAGLSVERRPNRRPGSLFKPPFPHHWSVSRSQCDRLCQKRWRGIHHSHGWEQRREKIQRKTEWASALCFCHSMTHVLHSFFLRFGLRRQCFFFFCALLIHCHLLCFCGLCTYRVCEMSGEDSGCELYWWYSHTAVWERHPVLCEPDLHSFQSKVCKIRGFFL